MRGPSAISIPASRGTRRGPGGGSGSEPFVCECRMTLGDSSLNLGVFRACTSSRLIVRKAYVLACAQRQEPRAARVRTCVQALSRVRSARCALPSRRAPSTESIF